MFASSKELNQVKLDLEALKDDTAILSERFLAHTKIEEKNSIEQGKKMDEIIGLVKESHSRIDHTAAKIHADLVGRLDREYSPTTVVDTKIAEMKNCVRHEFTTKETTQINHAEVTKDIKGVRDIAKSYYASIRREAYLAIVIITGFIGTYLNFYKVD